MSVVDGAMGEKTPDNERSGIERRDILKGLGFGAVSAVGGSAFAGNVAAQDGDCECASMIDYAFFVPPGEDHDTDHQQNSFADTPDGGMDLVFQLDSPGMPKGGSHSLAYQVGLVRQNQGNNPATKSVEDGRTRGFAGTVQTSPGGETQRREEFSTSGLLGANDPTQYWAVLTVTSYSSLSGSVPTDSAVIPVEITSS